MPAALPLDDAGGAATRVTLRRHGRRAPRARDRSTARSLARRAADGGRGDPPARRAQPRERDGRRRRLPRARRRRATPSARRWRRSRASPHRLEEVATVDGVTYVNDSKATNVASAEVGIRSFAGGVHLIAGGRGKGSDYAPLAAPVQSALRRRLPDRRDRRRAARGAARHRRPAPRLRRPRARRRRGARQNAAARRRRAALARLRVLRPVPLLRGARRPLPALVERSVSRGVEADAQGERRAARRRPGRRVEWRSDGQIAAAARAPTAADRHVLPAGGRRGDGLLGLVGADAAAGPGRRHGVPDQVRRLRRGRADRDARHLAAEARPTSAATRRAAADRRVRDAGAGQDPGHRRARSTARAAGSGPARCSSSRARS